MILAVSAIFLTVSATPSVAAVITQPTGLSASDSYRLAFVTSTGVGSFLSQTQYNTFVDDQTNRRELRRTLLRLQHSGFWKSIAN